MWQLDFSEYATTHGGTWRLAGCADYWAKHEFGWHLSTTCNRFDAIEAVDQHGIPQSRPRIAVVSGSVSEIVEGLDGAQRDRIEVLRKAGRFFWVDVSLSATSPSDLSESLGIPGHAIQGLLSIGDAHPSARTFLADGQRVVFGTGCYLESDEPRDGAAYRLRAVEVGVLVSGDYLLTVHQERLSLPALLKPYMPEGRSEQYAVYAVLDAIVASAFDALKEAEETLDELALMSAHLRAGRMRMATLRATSSRLSDMRRQAAPQRGLFERIGVEITRIEGLEADDERYFERIGEQLQRLVDAIDAAADAMARLIDLRLNETSYWLTVVATIFLPLTFITGFFGMNFGWMVEQVDTWLAFWLLGVGSLVVGVALIWRLIVRGSPVQEEHDAADVARRPSWTSPTTGRRTKRRGTHRRRVRDRAGG